MATIGAVRWSGTLVLAASGPGEIASIASGSISGTLMNTDIVIVQPSATATQTIVDNAGESIAFNVVKNGTSSMITVYANKKQTPQILLDYVVFTG